MLWVAKKSSADWTSPTRITGQIVFVRESFLWQLATRSEHLLLILHMALQLLYQNFVHTFSPTSYAG